MKLSDLLLENLELLVLFAFKTRQQTTTKENLKKLDYS